MKAIVMREFGPPEVMRLEDVPTPIPGPGEVLVRVHAVSVNRTLDLAVRAGVYPAAVTLPHVLGDRKSTRLNSSHIQKSRMPSSA